MKKNLHYLSDIQLLLLLTLERKSFQSSEAPFLKATWKHTLKVIYILFINKFQDLLIGKEFLNDLPAVLPKLKKQKEWDGKDYVPEKEEM